MEEKMCDCNIIHEDSVNKVLKRLPKEELFTDLANLFKILGDQTRTKILFTLDKSEMCVCDIANVLGTSKSLISHQLAVLREAKIVKYRRQGKEVFYSLDDDHIRTIFEIGIEHIEHKKLEEKNDEIKI